MKKDIERKISCPYDINANSVIVLKPFNYYCMDSPCKAKIVLPLRQLKQNYKPRKVMEEEA